MEKKEVKKSFILYTDYYEHIQLLSVEQKGQLLDAIFQYSLGQEIPPLDPLTHMAFSFIKSQLDRDKESYNNMVESRKKAGQKGGIAKGSKAKQKLAKIANAKFATKKIANVADTDTVTDNDNVNDTDTVTVTDTVTKKNLPSLFDQDDLQLEFDEMIGFYPKLSTGFSRKKAYDAWIEEITNGESKSEIKAGIIRYQLYIRESGKDGTKFIQSPHNFLANQAYKQQWEIPNEPKSTKKSVMRELMDGYQREKSAEYV